MPSLIEISLAIFFVRSSVKNVNRKNWLARITKMNNDVRIIKIFLCLIKFAICLPPKHAMKPYTVEKREITVYRN
jgi:hypothetical protein